ncbi:hypothetical protein ACWCO3_24545, partial [Micromonospora sp. NPDC002411]
MSAGPGPSIRRHRDRRVPLAALVAAGAAVFLAAAWLARIAAFRAKSMLAVDLPNPGLPATIT